MVSATKRQPLDTKRFQQRVVDQVFENQYYNIYNARLKAARPALIERSRFRWGEEVKNVPLEQLNASLGSTDVFVIGTLFKVMPQQPSILIELEELKVTPQGPNVNFTSDEDKIVLHETDENVQVVGDIDVHQHVTGIPVALLGHQLDGGAKFYVTDICYAGPSLSVYKSPQANSCDGDSQPGKNRMLILSGLEFGFDSTMTKEKTGEIIKSLKKLRDFIHGDCDATGDPNGFNDFTIDKVIVAGNSVCPGYTKAICNDLLDTQESEDKGKFKSFIHMFDKYLFTLAQSGLNIHVMPGKNDPTSFLLPQQPFHPKLLPTSSTLENVHPETNPCLIDYMDYTILGTSGENIEAIRQYSRVEFSTTALKNTLEWGHIAPSAPDNVSCLPFNDKDPFLIDFVPDIYFAGNQPEFAVTTYSTERKSKIQLISVPSFIESRSCVLIDMSNLEVELINLGA